MKLLIVEDYAADIYFLEYHMKRQGHDTICINNLKGSFEYIDWCDRILLDLNIKDSNGIDTLSRMKKMTDKPIIVITAEENEFLEKSCLEMGAAAYIRKQDLMEDIAKSLPGWTSYGSSIKDKF